MKLSLLIASAIAALLIVDVNSQFLPPFGLGLGGLGMGGLGMGGFGFPGLGLGLGGLGLGLGGFGGIGGFGGGLFGRGLGIGGGFGGGLGQRFLGRGKRDVENQITQIEVDQAIAENRTICSISTESHVLSCKGPNPVQNIDCELISTLGRFEDVKLRVNKLTLQPELIQNIGVFRIIGKSQDVTFVDPVDKKSHLLYLFSEQTVKKHGFIVRDRECYAQVVKMAASVVPEKFSLVLALNK